MVAQHIEVHMPLLKAQTLGDLRPGTDSKVSKGLDLDYTLLRRAVPV